MPNKWRSIGESFTLVLLQILYLLSPSLQPRLLPSLLASSRPPSRLASGLPVLSRLVCPLLATHRSSRSSVVRLHRCPARSSVGLVISRPRPNPARSSVGRLCRHRARSSVGHLQCPVAGLQHCSSVSCLLPCSPVTGLLLCSPVANLLHWYSEIHLSGTQLPTAFTDLQSVSAYAYCLDCLLFGPTPHTHTYITVGS